MKLLSAIVGINLFSKSAAAYYAMTIFAPQQPDIDSKVVNAKDKAFVIGADKPITYCGLDDQTRCPDGDLTLIDGDMTLLAASVPGGQFIFVSPDGSISYPSAHSSLRPPGAQMGGFYSAEVETDCDSVMTILAWHSDDGAMGLWACPTGPGVPLYMEATLKATTSKFTGVGCVAVEGIHIEDAGDDFGAWAYG